MVKVQVDLTEKADRKLRVYMALNDIDDKRIAINQILEREK